MVQYREGAALAPLKAEGFPEKELQEMLASHLELLQMDGDMRLHLLDSEVKLQSGLRLDLFLVDQKGFPVVVETKLFRNPEARRKVVAQVFGYVAELSSMSFDDIDDLLEGQLWSTISEFSDPISARKQFVAALKSGETRVIVAIDSAPKELVQILAFLSARNLDVRLVEVEKFRQGLKEFSYVSYHYSLHGERPNISVPSKSIPTDGQQVFPLVRDFFNVIQEEFPSMNCRDFRYGFIGMGARCEARFDYLNTDQTIRVAFKLWDASKRIIDIIVSKFPEVFGMPIYKEFSLRREEGRKATWFGARLPISGYEGGLESEELKQDVTRLLKGILASCAPIVQEVKKLKAQEPQSDSSLPQ